MPAYTLSALQNAAFTDTFDLYAPSNNTPSGKKHEGVAYTLVASSVRGRIQPKPESLQTGPLGRTNRDQIDTTDILRVHTSETVGSTYFVKLTTSGHPEANSWYAVLGDARHQFWKAKTSEYFITKSTAPLLGGLSQDTIDGVEFQEIIQ